VKNVILARGKSLIPIDQDDQHPKWLGHADARPVCDLPWVAKSLTLEHRRHHKPHKLWLGHADARQVYDLPDSRPSLDFPGSPTLQTFLLASLSMILW
jgi:hypothetical protein